MALAVTAINRMMNQMNIGLGFEAGEQMTPTLQARPGAAGSTGQPVQLRVFGDDLGQLAQAAGTVQQHTHVAREAVRHKNVRPAVLIQVRRREMQRATASRKSRLTRSR